MKIFYALFFTSFVILLNLSCNKNPITPPENQPGRRDYVWTEDTLDMEMNFIHTIWGASPNDVWAMGESGSAHNRLWHFDGNEWSVYKGQAIFCGGRTLFGFNTNDVWMGGDDETSNGASIWHYDGTKWSPNYFYNIQGSYIATINKIYGSDPNDIYACGIVDYGHSNPNGLSDSIQGFVLHYNGTSWNEVVQGKLNDQLVDIVEFNNIAYIYGIKLSLIKSGNNILSLYRVNGDSLAEIYSNTEDNVYGMHFANFGGSLYFSIFTNFYTYHNSKFVTQFSIDKPNFSYFFFGRNKKDIFLNMTDGSAHYNGNDIEYLLKYPRYSRAFGGTIVFDKEVFQVYLDRTSNKNMVLHGILKN